MLYPNLKFSKSPKSRPFFYTNFVSTLDGKVTVPSDEYWPIGSKKDYETLVELRSYADCLIHGGVLARKHGEITLNSIAKSSFKKIRQKNGKTSNLPYYVLSRDPKNLGLKHPSAASVFRSLPDLMKNIKKQGFKHILVEGGPTLLGSFIKEGLIDEIFLTLAPKIFGSKPDSTKTLIEGVLLPKNKFTLKLLSVNQIKDELFLRYQVKS